MCQHLYLDSRSWLKNSTTFISIYYISCNMLVITNKFLENLKEKQLVDLNLKNILTLLDTNKAKGFSTRKIVS